MKIHLLFHPSGPGESAAANEVVRMLDLPDDSLEKQAFLDRCAVDEGLRRDWETVNRTMAMGRRLSSPEPPAALRQRIAAAARHDKVIRPFEPAAKPAFRVSGWRWAWAAIFLVMIAGGAAEFQNQSSGTSISSIAQNDALDQELLSLDEEMAALFSDFESQFETAFTGTAS